VSTRMIGTLIMAHSDDDGLILPPRVATQQIVILPVSPKEETREAVFVACQDLAASLRKQFSHGDALRVHVDTRDLNGGVKKWEWIKKGVPIRIEIGPRDLESGKVCVQRRDQAIAQKEFMTREEFVASAAVTLDEIHGNLLARALEFRAGGLVHGHLERHLPGDLERECERDEDDGDQLHACSFFSAISSACATAGAVIITPIKTSAMPIHCFVPMCSPSSHHEPMGTSTC